jgi:hypothetical protein
MGVQALWIRSAGNYGNYVDSRLIRHCPFVLPPADQDPGLRFWHWFSFYANEEYAVNMAE